MISGRTIGGTSVVPPRATGDLKKVSTMYSTAPGTIERVTAFAIRKSSRCSPTISASCRQRSSMLMLSIAIIGVRVTRANIPASGSKSVSTISGFHSSTVEIQLRTVSGMSRRALRTFCRTVCQRWISPSCIAKLGPKTSSTRGRRSDR